MKRPTEIGNVKPWPGAERKPLGPTIALGLLYAAVLFLLFVVFSIADAPELRELTLKEAQ